jgi:hypothetical protein
MMPLRTAPNAVASHLTGICLDRPARVGFSLPTMNALHTSIRSGAPGAGMSMAMAMCMPMCMPARGVRSA